MSKEHDQEVERIVVSVQSRDGRVLQPGYNAYVVPELKQINKQSRLNKKYNRIITQESETVKHLYSMLSPKMANF